VEATLCGSSNVTIMVSSVISGALSSWLTIHLSAITNRIRSMRSGAASGLTMAAAPFVTGRVKITHQCYVAMVNGTLGMHLP
jgi:LytS/YehU family sensor histidine kinase